MWTDTKKIINLVYLKIKHCIDKKDGIHVHLETSDDYRKMSKIFEQEGRVFHIQTCRRENIEDRHERNLSSRQNRRNQRRFHRQGL